MSRTGRELHLHVGLPKTGTTSIQAGLLANRDLLARAGLSLAPRHNRAGAHHDLGLMLGREGPKAFIAALAQDNTTRQVVSTEILVGQLAKRPELLDGLLTMFRGELTIHLSLRRWDAFCESMYAQLGRNYLAGWRAKPAPSIEMAVADGGECGPDLAAQLRRMLETVVSRRGPEAVRLSVYPEGGGRNAFATFLGAILPDLDPAQLVEEPTRNPSISRRKTVLLAGFGEVPERFRRHLLDRVQRSRAVRDDGIRPLLPPETRRALVEATADEFRAMARLTGLPEAELAPLLTPPPPEPDWRPPEPITAAEALRFAAAGWRPRRLLHGGRRRAAERLAAEAWITGRVISRPARAVGADGHASRTPA